MEKFIHLLYVPTMACNMKCRYCYLEENTVDSNSAHTPLETLSYAVNKLAAGEVIPFNISLHGGEVTTLSTDDFSALIEYISRYYREKGPAIKAHGFPVGKPHIKTNLFALDRHIETIKEFNVSVSGSLDLPLSLHDEYRITKSGRKTLDKILANIKLLDDEHIDKKKISATVFREHFERLDELIADIRYLHESTPLDMNDFNLMIGFDYQSNGLLHPLSEQEQVELFRRLHEEFDGTELDAGVNGAWFNEFGPDYCTNCDNCADKFFLLERNGDIYSCVRGQKHKDYYYGNIYTDSVESILETARLKVFANHNRLPMNEDCLECEYLYLCKTGCPFVKNVYGSNKSYTCKLQLELYKSRGLPGAQDTQAARYNYLCKMHPELMEQYLPDRDPPISVDVGLRAIIQKDQRLRYIYEPGVFRLKVDETEFTLESQILKGKRTIIYITEQSNVTLYVKKSLLDEQCDYPQSNTLYMMLLSGDMLTYGDEGRHKQRHIMTHQVFRDVMEKMPTDREGFYQVELAWLINKYADEYDQDYPNNMFFTTSALRDYHYVKQKNNAFYHIQAINLPFQNIEFFYVRKTPEVLK